MVIRRALRICVSARIERFPINLARSKPGNNALRIVSRSMPRRGFILLLVVIFILIAGLLASSISIRSMASVAEARRLEDQLRHRWARVSLQRAVLERGNQCFAAFERRGRIVSGGPNALDGTYILSGISFRVRLSDEGAKINLLQAVKKTAPERVIEAGEGLGGSIPVETTR
jgi:type II secretory pathway pseudopilin PulG